MALSIIVFIIILFLITLLIGGLIFMSRTFSLKNVYLYLVCFVTLLIFIFGTIYTVQKVVDLAVDGGYYYTSLEDYEQRFYTFKEDGTRDQTLTQEEIQVRYEEYLNQERERARVNNIRQLASSVSAMVVGGVFWFYHWKKISQEQE